MGTTKPAPLRTRHRRPSSSALDALLGQRLAVLDDGFVRLIDYMGDDTAIVQAARVSYGAGTKTVRTDRALIRYLMRHSHTSPFEMCELKLHVRVPMDAWRQWIRHRTASVNEYSTRYSIAIDSAQRTDPSAWRLQSPSGRQGSEGLLPPEIGAHLSRRESRLQSLAKGVYLERLERGVAREQARKDLPLSTYTEAYWKIDLHNLLHFLELRLAESAQPEIRAYASVIGNTIVARWCPLTWEAFRDFRVEAMRLTRVESQLIALLLRQKTTRAATRLGRAAGLLTDERPAHLTREGRELRRKVQQLGLRLPWE